MTPRQQAQAARSADRDRRDKAMSETEKDGNEQARALALAFAKSMHGREVIEPRPSYVSAMGDLLSAGWTWRPPSSQPAGSEAIEVLRELLADVRVCICEATDPRTRNPVLKVAISRIDAALAAALSATAPADGGEAHVSDLMDRYGKSLAYLAKEPTPGTAQGVVDLSAAIMAIASNLAYEDEDKAGLRPKPMKGLSRAVKRAVALAARLRTLSQASPDQQPENDPNEAWQAQAIRHGWQRMDPQAERSMALIKEAAKLIGTQSSDGDVRRTALKEAIQIAAESRGSSKAFRMWNKACNHIIGCIQDRLIDTPASETQQPEGDVRRTPCDACGGEGQKYTSRYGGNDPDVWPTGTCEVCEGTGLVAHPCVNGCHYSKDVGMWPEFSCTNSCMYDKSRLIDTPPRLARQI